MSYLTLEDVSYCYPDGFKAIENISMKFDLGESVAIIGQNGAGKTTTVKLMNGLIKPTAGNVTVDGWNTKEFTTAQLSKKVGYVYQNPDDQIFHNKVYSEIEFGPKKIGLSKNRIKENILSAAELTGIEPYLDEHPYDLPYSLRKFITIASVIAMNPKLIILDEPTAGQDGNSLKRLSHIIHSLTRQGKTVITITHDMEFVAENFNRVIVMANKRKIADSNKREIFWNLDVLEAGKVKQPHLSQLSRKLNLQDKIIHIDEMILSLKK
ncbi:energy-coupling factor ABC transporter ATP-binding protein [Neobacillus sp. NPDC058068]|uniref:energy-coupling factor ABC transporter ATP-binding protein n=1 Tax=Neobacillus sp. NPDC058068 TaxID=3346325 RepID=UPI0036D9157E